MFEPDKDNFLTVRGYKRHVVCAANRFPCGTVLLGARHWDAIMCDVATKLGLKGGNEEQGFIDQWQNFMTRKEASAVVLGNNQTLRETPIEGDILFSENLY